MVPWPGRWGDAMRVEILNLALIVGAFTWAFRFFPIWTNSRRQSDSGGLDRFLAATGPAAIATLFVASILPLLQTGWSLPLVGGTLAVLLSFWLRPSVIGATVAGALAYGTLSAI